MASSIDRKLAKFSFNPKVRMRLYRKLQSFMRQGMPLHDVLHRLHTLYSRKRGDARAVAIGEWLMAMRGGKSLAEAMRDWAPAAEIMLIESGERGGQLESALGYAIEVTESIIKMKKAVVSSVAYQALLFAMLIGMIFLFSLNVVPQLAEILDPGSWPGAAAHLYTMSYFVTNWWWAVLVVGAISGYVIKWSLPNYTGGVRHKMDALPPWSIYKTINSAVFLVALAALMKTGTPLMDAISRLRIYAPKYGKFHMSKMLIHLRQGMSNGRALNTGYLDQESANDIEVYGDLADFQSAMEQIGEEVIEDAIERIEINSKVIGNILLISIGVFVGWVYYAFFTLTTSISSSASSANF